MAYDRKMPHDNHPRKADVHVCRNFPRSCPSCKRSLNRSEYVGKNNQIMKAELATCGKCKKTYVSAWFYYKHRNRLNSLNPDESNIFIQEILEQNKQRKALRDALYDEVITKKTAVYEKVLPSLNTTMGFKPDEFRREWLRSAIGADTLIAALIINETHREKKKKGKYECVFISDSNNVEKLSKTVNSGFCIVNTHNLVANRAIASIKSGYMYFLIRGQRYNVCKTIVLNEEKFRNLVQQTVSHDEYYLIHTPKKINKSEVVNYAESNRRDREPDEDRYVYVYFSLTNTCMKKKHDIETVTAKTTDIKSGRPIEVNVFYCNRCDRYFINFEALQRYISRGIYPALHYIFDNFVDNKLNDASELMLYGYNVKEGDLSLYERRKILEWVIDYGLMTKAEIIRNLQFKVNYNGRKAGNERARQKWLDDIQFVSRYVSGNSREIKAVFVFKNRNNGNSTYT